jgi:hypothetical protein
VQRRFTEWRQRTMLLLTATDRFINRLLEAVEEGLLEDGRGHPAAHAPADVEASSSADAAGAASTSAEATGASSSSAEATGAGSNSAQAVVIGSSTAREEAVVADSSAVAGPGAAADLPGAAVDSQERAGTGSGGAIQHTSSLRQGAGSRRTRSQAAAEAAGASTAAGSARSGKRTRFADNEDS